MANYAKKKKNKSKESAGMQTTDYILSVMCSMYVFCMLCIYPLYYENKYFNMGDAKYHFFKYVSVFFLVAMLFAVVAWLAARRKEMNFAIIARTFSYPDWFAVGFFVFSYFSFVLSEYKETAFYGYDGWYMGMMSQFAFVIIYFLVSRFWRWSPTTLLFALGTAAITYQLGIWQRFLIDPLGMYIDLGPEYIEKFVSTLGQTTWFSSYAVLIFPIGMFYYCYDEKKWARIFAGIFLALGYGMLATTNSDSAYVAFILILMAFFWFALESNQTFGRFLEAVLIGLASFRVIGICRLLFPEKQITLITGDEAITAFVTGSGLMLFLLVAVAVLYGVYRYVCKVNKEFSVRKFVFLRSVMVWAAVLAVWLVLLLIILVSKEDAAPTGILQKVSEISFFRFDDQWGNHRGFNWRMAIEAFKNASLKDVLVGAGPDCFACSMDKYCFEEVYTYWQGLQLACAHNEWLNMLVTQGVLGVASYIGIFVTVIIRMGKIGKTEPAVIPFLAATLAYMGHNFFCYQQCICTPIVFIMMGIGEMIVRHTTQEQSGKKA
ncbi:MAG: O-antigen ligase family protein [Lachnospiraceae bacterium]|nr:O-antigen ligase family protein [Lachnospiraceae bacterium]